MSLEIWEAGRKRMPSMLPRNIEPFQLEHQAGQLDSHRICLQLLISASTASTVLPFVQVFGLRSFTRLGPVAQGTVDESSGCQHIKYYAPLKGFVGTRTSLSLAFKVSPLDHCAFEH